QRSAGYPARPPVVDFFHALQVAHESADVFEFAPEAPERGGIAVDDDAFLDLDAVAGTDAGGRANWLGCVDSQRLIGGAMAGDTPVDQRAAGGGQAQAAQRAA